MSIWKKFLGRLSEPSTYAGAAAVAYGVGELGKVKEAPAIAEAIGTAGQVAAGGDWVATVAVLGMGIAAAFLPERGKRDD
ncbi:MAG: hypothetical protein ACFCUQ_10140 [Kiloniellales bacterium]